MKSILLFIIVTSFVITGTLSAHEMGLKGAFNFGKLTGEEVEHISGELDFIYHMGYSAGFFINVPFSGVFSIRPEVLYTNNGAQYEGTEEEIEYKMVMNMNWLSIPVLAVFYLGPVKVFGGPYFDMFLNGKVKYEVSYSEELYEEEEDIESEDIPSFMYGAIVGIALGIGDRIDLEVRYSQGISTLDKEPDGRDSGLGKYEKSDYKPSMIQVLLNFNIPH